MPDYVFETDTKIKSRLREIMSGPSSYEPKTAIERWIDVRLPIVRFSVDLLDFPTP